VAATGVGASITPAYREKFRTLFFGLKKNLELGQRILVGEVSPERLIRLSKEELADKEALELRNMVLEKSRKRVVLDDEAAAKFSTAANQALVRKELQVCCHLWPQRRRGQPSSAYTASGFTGYTRSTAEAIRTVQPSWKAVLPQ
jgi:hypothetical protein